MKNIAIHLLCYSKIKIQMKKKSRCNYKIWIVNVFTLFFSGKTYFLLNMFKKILNIFIKNSEVMLKILILIIINYSFHISIEHIYMNLSLKTNPIVEIIPKGLNFWTNVFR